MVLLFYHSDISPPSRSVLWTLKELDLEYEVKNLNLFQADHKTPEYLSINPRGKVPALVDGDLKLSESRAIAAYLCNMYAKDGKKQLYPSDPETRAVVDMNLYITEWVFDQVMAYMNFGGILFRGENVLQDKLDGAKDSLKLLDKTLEGQQYLAGDSITIADFFGYPSVLFLEAVGFTNFSEFRHLEEWISRMRRNRFCAEVNDKGMEESVAAVKAKLHPKS